MSCDLLFKMLLKGVLCMCECLYVHRHVKLFKLDICINWETCVSTCVCVLCVYEHIVGGRVYSSRTGLDFTNFFKKMVVSECENLAFYHCISSLLKHLVGTELVSTHWICCYSVAKLCPTPLAQWTVALQAPLSMRISRQKYCSGLPFPSLGLSLQPRNWTCPSCIGSWILHHQATREACLVNEKKDFMLVTEWLPC